MKLKWLGHAAFLITSEKGTRIITDPYKVEGNINYSPIPEKADIVTVSHDHFDHNNAAAVKGNPTVVKGAGKQQIKDIGIEGIATYHDTSQGSQRGPNVIFALTVDGMRVCHLGDLGHPLSEAQRAQLGAVDILLVPVGGTYTIDAGAAMLLVGQLQPRVAVPMHYKTEKCGLPIADVGGFLQGRVRVRQVKGSEVEFKKEQLPKPTETVVLEHDL